MQSTTEQSEVFSPSDEERDCIALKKKISIATQDSEP